MANLAKDRKQIGLVLIAVGICALVVSLLTLIGHPYLRGLVGGLGIAVVVYGIAHVYPKHIKTIRK